MNTCNILRLYGEDEELDYSTGVMTRHIKQRRHHTCVNAEIDIGGKTVYL